MSESQIVLTAFVVVALSACYCWHEERKKWNQGVCRESGKPWHWFTYASDGSRGYTDGEGHYLWLSWYRGRYGAP